jgi:preprotein translocase subunit SecG
VELYKYSKGAELAAAGRVSRMLNRGDGLLLTIFFALLLALEFQLGQNPGSRKGTRQKEAFYGNNQRKTAI